MCARSLLYDKVLKFESVSEASEKLMMFYLRYSYDSCYPPVVLT